MENELDYSTLNEKQQAVLHNIVAQCKKYNGWSGWSTDHRTAQALKRRGWLEQRGIVGDPWHGAEYRLTPAGREAYKVADEPTPAERAAVEALGEAQDAPVGDVAMRRCSICGASVPPSRFSVLRDAVAVCDRCDKAMDDSVAAMDYIAELSTERDAARRQLAEAREAYPLLNSQRGQVAGWPPPDDWQASDALFGFEIAWISTHGLEPIPSELYQAHEERLAIEAERDQLRAELAAATAHNLTLSNALAGREADGHTVADFAKMTAMLHILEAELTAAQAALKPFADMYKKFIDHPARVYQGYADILTWMSDHCDNELTEANYERALTASEGGE